MSQKNKLSEGRVRMLQARARRAARMLAIALPAMLAIVYAPASRAQAGPFETAYAEHCGVCHGERMEGTAQGTPLVRADLQHGESVDAIAGSIAAGFQQPSMPGWSGTLSPELIRGLAILISERRADLAYTDFKVDAPLRVPGGLVASERHTFTIQTVATNLDALPFSIAPLPDGRILLTEKTRGLSIVSPDGKQSELIRGAPTGFDDGFEAPGTLLVYGTGWIMDVALHPDYERNGWIYLQYGDRCSGCNALSRASGAPVSMNKLVRGRIEQGAWVDEETIWSTDIENYTPMPDMAAGGRISFDGRGHLFISIGMKGASNFAGIQDLSLPYGKIHRLNDDGSIPDDNPFAGVPGALASIWTYGHRSPQGLEFDPRTGQLWETEMGPRGGDEVNLLVPGKNYGWPLYSKGMDYDGTPVEYGVDLGIEFDSRDIEQPIVDLTPSPAVSSFVVYDGPEFPGWRGDMLVGTLKATELYRMGVVDGRVVETETLLDNFMRIRDIELGSSGEIYLLVEHASGARILRMVRADGRDAD